MTNSSTADPKRAFLRHTLATLAYRGGKTLRDAPVGFAGFATAPGDRTPARILSHLSDLLDWSLSIARGAAQWHDTPPAAWDDDVKRFFEALARLDEYLASDAPLAQEPELLFQGPIADALTHVGQLAMLRRLSGSPMRGENYFVADIKTGRVGIEQAPPRREF